MFIVMQLNIFVYTVCINIRPVCILVKLHQPHFTISLPAAFKDF